MQFKATKLTSNEDIVINLTIKLHKFLVNF